MVDRIQLEGLQIIGYADDLPDTMLPSVVPPVFQSKAEPNRIFLPPYHMNRGFLWDATEVSHAELEELKDDGEVTLFDTRYDARRDYELWIDQCLQPNYQPQVEATENLLRIADNHIARAEAALKMSDLNEADRLSGVAAAADDRKLEPFAIKAAIRRFEGNRTGVQLMTDLAPKMAGGLAFSLEVDHYFRMIPQLNVRPDDHLRNIPHPPLRYMLDAATHRAA